MAGRRSDTRERIQDAALELFLEHGYEKASLREIAERLEVTKAALYYHFRTKEDIVHALLAEFEAAIDELIEWGRSQPVGAERREELLRRFSALVSGSFGPVMELIQQNVPAMKALGVMPPLAERIRALFQLVGADVGDEETALRARLALVALVIGISPIFGVHQQPPPPDVALRVALDLVGKRS